MKMRSLKIIVVVLGLCAARSVFAVNELQALKMSVTAYGKALTDMAYVLEEILIENKTPMTPSKGGIEMVLGTQGVITPGLHGADATVNLSLMWALDPLDDTKNLSFNVVSDSANVKRLDLIEKIRAFNNAATVWSRFVNGTVSAEAQVVICDLERMKTLTVDRFTQIANAVISIDLGDENADLENYALLNANKHDLGRAIVNIAKGVRTDINTQVNLLRPSAQPFSFMINEGCAFVQNNYLWFIGGGATAIVLTGALAYVMRDRLSFRKLPLLGRFFRKAPAVAVNRLVYVSPAGAV